MNKADTINTLRLKLERITRDDVEEIAAIKSITVEKAMKWVQKILDPASETTYVWAIHFDERVVGTICLWNIIEEKAELGYDIHNDHRKRGFAYEAGEAVVRFAKEKGFGSAEAYCEKDNEPSLRTLTKLGFIKTGDKDEFNIYTKKC